MPEGTLKALADHGALGGTLTADGGDCEAVLARFAAAGVDVDALAGQLQDEGRGVRQLVARADGRRRQERRARYGELRAHHARARRRRRRDSREGARHRTDRAAGVSLRAHAHRRADGRRGQDRRRGMAIRRGLDRLSGPGAQRSSRSGAAQPRWGLGRLRLSEGLWLPGEGRQRCRDASARELPRRQVALSRPRHRARIRIMVRSIRASCGVSIITACPLFRTD